MHKRIRGAIPTYQPKKYPELDKFINELPQQAWLRIIAAYTFSGKVGILELIRREYADQFANWGDIDLLHYLRERELKDFLPVRQRPA